MSPLGKQFADWQLTLRRQERRKGKLGLKVSISSEVADIDAGNASWGPVLAMALGAFVLVASEFMPVSLLTPIASDLGVSEGHAGQAISISGAFAVIASLCLSSLAGKINRKLLLLSLTLLMMISGTIVAFAPNYLIFMIGRALIGLAIGGFWSMSTATAMRLVPSHHVPKALAIVNGGNALATVIAAPMGSFLGSIVGWRYAFFCVVPVAAIAFGWKAIILPSMTVQESKGRASIFRLLTKPTVLFGLMSTGFLFMGQFTLFTYLRPFLENVTHVNASMLSLLLLVIGVAGFFGTTVIGSVLNLGLYRILVVIPVLMAAIAVAFILCGHSLVIVALLLCGWGITGTSAPVGWWTWLAKTLPDDAEAGGGLIVAIVQLSIMLGATAGGFLFDAVGYQATFGMSATMLVIASLLTLLAARTSHLS